MPGYTQKLLAKKNFPYQNLYLSTNIYMNPVEDQQTVKEFLEQVSSKLKGLTILHTNMLAKRSLLHLEHFQDQANFGNLTKLSILVDEEGTPRVEDLTQSFQFYNKLFETAKDLTDITLKCQYGSETMLYHLLHHLAKLGNRRITKFTIHADISERHVKQMAGLEIRIKDLDLEIGPLSTAQNVREFLKAQTHSIKRLTIGAKHLNNTVLLEFPVMKHLESLIVNGTYKRPPVKLRFKNVSYVDQFPHLKYLEFASYAEDNLQDFISFDVAHRMETLEELVLPDSAVTTELVREAGRIFPRLRKLEMSPNYAMTIAALKEMWVLSELVVNNVQPVWPGPQGSTWNRLPSVVKRDYELGTLFLTNRLDILRFKLKADQAVEFTEVRFNDVLSKLKHLEQIYLDTLIQSRDQNYFRRASMSRCTCRFRYFL